MSFVKEKLLNTLTKYWKLLEFIIDDKIDMAKREVALGEIGTIRGSTSETDGRVGLVPAPKAGDESDKYLKADGTWDIPYETATDTNLGITKLYTTSGNNIDGAVTQSALTNLLDEKANNSHGNHVPATEAADDTKFLRNDNTWQTVKAISIADAGNGTTITARYSGAGLESTSWLCCWNGYIISPIAPSKLGFLPLSGGTVTGIISKAGISTSWNKGRDSALLALSTLSGYSPAITLKTVNGSWDIGTYNSASYPNELIFSYITDSLYSGTNTTPPQIRFGTNYLCLPSGIKLY